MKRKVLFVIESLSGGGAEKVLASIIQNFDYSKYEVTVCSIVDVGKYKEVIKQHANYCYIIPDAYGQSMFLRIWVSIIYKLFYYLLPISWAYNFFIPKGFDIEVAFVEGFVTKLISNKRFSINSPFSRKIAWVHCDLMEYPWPVETKIYKNLEEEKKAYSQFDKIVVVSESSKKHFVEIYGNTERTHCIYNPVDKAEILALATEPVDCQRKTKFRFIAIGRLMEVKGFDRLIEAASRLHNDGLEFELWILGEGPECNMLNNLCSRLKVQDNIKFLGFQINPYKYLAQCDCFVCSSRTEGYSLVIAEAMIVGLPVISTRCAGPEEILSGSRFGIMVDNSTNGIYEGMKETLLRTNLSDLIALSKERARVFDLKKTMDKVYKIIG